MRCDKRPYTLYEVNTIGFKFWKAESNSPSKEPDKDLRHVEAGADEGPERL